jgi:hypothetical protein
MEGGVMPATYTAQQGDCLLSIASRFGIRDWEVLRDAPDNRDLMKARPDPGVLYPGDEVFVPDSPDAPKVVTASTERLHRYVVTLPKTLLRIQVKDEEERPLAGKKYELDLGGGVVRRGSTDGDGILEEAIDPSLTQARLTVLDGEGDRAPTYLWDIAIGALNPVDVPSGIGARLNNLGFFGGEANDSIDEVDDAPYDERMAMAVAGFQKALGLEPTGALDAATRAKLVETHGKT